MLLVIFVRELSEPQAEVEIIEGLINDLGVLIEQTTPVVDKGKPLVDGDEEASIYPTRRAFRRLNLPSGVANVELAKVMVSNFFGLFMTGKNGSSRPCSVQFFQTPSKCSHALLGIP